MSNTIYRGGGSGTVLWQEPQGLRLSSTNNVYVPTADVTGVGTLYWTTEISGGTGIVTGYNGSTIASKAIQQKSIAVSMTSGKIKNVYYDYDADALALGADWTNDTTPSETIADEQGAKVLSSDHTKLYLGVVRADGSNTIADSKAKPWVVNTYNRMPRPLFTSNSGSHLYTSTYREWNAGTGSVRLELLLPDKTYPVSLTLSVQGTIAANGLMQTNMTVDATTTSGTGFLLTNEIIFHLSTSHIFTQDMIKLLDIDTVGIGYHYVAVVEQGQGAGGTWDIGAMQGLMAR